MNKSLRVFILLLVTAAFPWGCDSYNLSFKDYYSIPIPPPSPPPSIAYWARTVEAGLDQSQFYAVAADGAGNIYAAGYQRGNGIFDYGGGVSVAATGGSSFGNVVLVKYNAAGDALWAKTLEAGPSTGTSVFLSVAVDGTGNVYAAGYQDSTGLYNYGNGVTAQGTSSSHSVILVKYNAAGAAQWAKTLDAGLGETAFYSVAVDGTGNVYAAGYQGGNGTYDYGNSVTAQGPSSSTNVILVKYNAVGDTQWAKTAAGLDVPSAFYSVTANEAGYVYTAGYQYGTGTLDYGNGASAQGTYGGPNVVLVKYDAAGDAQWAKTVDTGLNQSMFYSVAADGAAVYAAGVQSGTGPYDYGNGASAQGTYGGPNVVLVKYDAAGDAQWARTVTGSSDSQFNSVAVDGAAVYAAGYQTGNGTYNYGNGVSAHGTASGTSSNVVLVKYNAAGDAQWARSVEAGSSASLFNSVAVDGAAVYAAGGQSDAGIYNYGDGKTAQGTASGTNVVLVKYPR